MLWIAIIVPINHSYKCNNILMDGKSNLMDPTIIMVIYAGRVEGSLKVSDTDSHTHHTLIWFTTTQPKINTHLH